MYSVEIGSNERAPSYRREMPDQSGLYIHQRERHGEPQNAETKAEALTSSLQTPTGQIFHRNHGDIVQVPNDVPAAVEQEWKVTFSVEEDLFGDERTTDNAVIEWHDEAKTGPVSIEYGEMLHSRGACLQVEINSVTAAMECAGNRRADLNENQESEGIPWQAGAISNASWHGVSLRSLLLNLGMPDAYAHHDTSSIPSLSLDDGCMRRDCADWAKSLHLHLLSAQSIPNEEESAISSGTFFAASVPLYIVMHPRQDCMLATHQNGQLLTQAHGFPLRAVIPGHIGARWVKWLRGLRVSARPDDSPPMKMDYKLLVPPQNSSEEEKQRWISSISGEHMDMEKRNSALSEQEPLQRMGVGSAITKPQEGATITGKSMDVQGYAVGHNGESLSQVEVIIIEQGRYDESSDDLRQRASRESSQKWTGASLQGERADGPGATWSWSLWSAELQMQDHLHKGQYYAVVARAVTQSGQMQEQQSQWNVRGFAVRSWPVIRNLAWMN